MNTVMENYGCLRDQLFSLQQEVCASDHLPDGFNEKLRYLNQQLEQLDNFIEDFRAEVLQSNRCFLSSSERKFLSEWEEHQKLMKKAQPVMLYLLTSGRLT